MDANGTKYQLLLGERDWSRCLVGRDSLATLKADSPLRYDNPNHELRLADRLFRFEASRGNRSSELADRRGAARDRFGNFFWIDPTATKILVLSSGTQNISTFWPVERRAKPLMPGAFHPIPSTPLLPRRFSGLTVTRDHYLLVGLADASGALLFDLYGGGTPVEICWPTQFKIKPFDIAAAADGGAWILDHDAQQLWRLDRNMALLDAAVTDSSQSPWEDEAPPAMFQPADRSTMRCQMRTHPSRPMPLPTLSPQPLEIIAIDVLPDGSVLLLDRNPSGAFSRVYRVKDGQQQGPISLDTVTRILEEPLRGNFRLKAHDFAFVPANPKLSMETESGDLLGTLYVAATDGDQAFVFGVVQKDGQISLYPESRFVPMRLFTGTGLIADDKRAYYDSSGRWVPLVEQKRPRYQLQAVLTTPPDRDGTSGFFDGKIPNCVWHRVMLDACIPPGTSVQVSTRAAEDWSDLKDADWSGDVQPYLRPSGSEIPFAKASFEATGNGTWEALIQNTRGRYLQLRLTITGDGRDTPRIRAVRVYYPRFSYPEKYLPAAYRDEPESASFLERFLANPEGFFTAIEDKMTAVQMLLDWRTVPDDAVPWLMQWFGTSADRGWSLHSRRILLKHAMTFLQYRGTIRGLRMALELLEDCPDESLFTEPPSKPEPEKPWQPRIIEHYRTRRVPAVVLGDPSDAAAAQQALITPRWRPSEGNAALSQRYAAAVQVSGATYPLTDPGGDSAKWRAFSRAALGFVPAATPGDNPAWGQFLRRRYRTLKAANSIYAQGWKKFAEAQVFKLLPDSTAQLQDWFDFESIVLPIRAAAHRFSVMLPVRRTAMFDPAERARRMGLAQRVINLEKPAHTTFDVKFFYAMFRVGEARLGIDSVAERGSRDPLLMPPMILGQGFLSEAVLTASPPQDATDRQILGRDPVVTSCNAKSPKGGMEP